MSRMVERNTIMVPGGSLLFVGGGFDTKGIWRQICLVVLSSGGGGQCLGSGYGETNRLSSVEMGKG